MKYRLATLFLIYSTFSFSQEKEKPKTNIYDNLYMAEISYTTKLSKEKWFLQNKLKISNAFEFNKIEYLPISVNYHITKKWTVFTGPKLRYNFIHNDFYLGNQSNFNTSIQIGTRYKFSKNFIGEIIYEYNLLNNKNYDRELEESRGRLTFGIVIRF